MIRLGENPVVGHPLLPDESEFWSVWAPRFKGGLQAAAPTLWRLSGLERQYGPFEQFRDKWTNFLDLATAIEIFTPVYQFFLTDNDFWRASNSLQLDEVIGIYAATIMDCPEKLTALNNKHPMIPLPTTGAAFRLLLHGFSTEVLHALLVEAKRRQQSVVLTQENGAGAAV